MPNPEPQDPEAYPPDVRTAADRHRWDLAIAIAREWYGPQDRLLIRMTARSLFDSGIDT
jgi:hypothetical protein